jgi:PAS domain S-box-containing protein
MSGNYSSSIPWLNPLLLRKSGSRRLILFTSLFIVIILSSFDVAGWIFSITFFKSFGSSWEPMKLITAMSFIFSSLALIIIHLDFKRPIISNLSIVIAALICFISVSSLYTYFYFFRTGQELSFERSSLLKLFLLPANKMAFLTAINFLLLSCVIIFLQSKKTILSGIAHFIIIPVFLIGYYTIVSYLLGVTNATGIDQVSVALNTGLAFCGLCLAVLVMRPETWLLKIFLSDEIAGIISRRLLPPLIILPVIIGWLRIQGERSSLFNSEQGVILVATIYTAFFILLVWLTARNVNRIDFKRKTSEEQLRESEERFKAISEASPVGIGVIGLPETRFIYTNPAYEQNFGYNKDELLGKTTPEIYFDPDDRERIIKILNENKFVSNHEVKLKRKDGSSFWTISSISHITFMNKPALLGTFIDITKRKQAEESLRISEQRLKSHIENSPLAVIEFSDDFRINQWSIEAEHIFGWSKSEVLGLSLSELNMMVEEDISIASNSLERLKSGKELKVVSSYRNYSKAGEIKECIWYNSVLSDQNGHMSSVMSLVLDVTESRKTEQKVIERTRELEDVNSRLQRELRERIKIQEALKKSEKELIELNATKDKFFNIVAHDLKNPFTSLIGSSELLYQNINSLDRNSIMKLASILNDSAKSGYSILQNLLDWSRSQTGLLKISPRKINLKELIEENISNLQLLASNKEISIINETTSDISLVSDKNMINTVLRNLLSNAIKFTPRAGKVILRVKAENGFVSILVKDNGVGISSERIGKLFNLDTKNSSPGTENEQGTGLGLKLSKEFVEKLGGRIWVKSTVVQGSEFSFTIPYNGSEV